MSRHRLTRRTVLGLLAGLGAAGGALALAPTLSQALARDKAVRDVRASSRPLFDAYTYRRMSGHRTVVYGADASPVAVLTDGSRSVLLTGPHRRFTDPHATRAVIDSRSWVRLAPRAWADGQQAQPWFRGWLRAALRDTRPDALGVAMQYLTGAPVLRDDQGVPYAGDAGFGPRTAKGARQTSGGREERSDFYDYLGTAWTFPDGKKVKPRHDRYRDVDCSGYLRLVFGYRMGLPLYNVDARVPGLPRRAYAIAKYAPATTILSSRSTAPDPDQLTRLQPGDLLFFALNSDPAFLSHSGIYVGPDNAGRLRFVSSRSTVNGPTFGDVDGDGVIDGDGFFATRLRKAIRL